MAALEVQEAIEPFEKLHENDYLIKCDPEFREVEIEQEYPHFFEIRNSDLPAAWYYGELELDCD